MRGGVDAQELSVRGHHLRREERIDREAVLADEIADAATEGDPADADRTRVAEADGQPLGADGRAELGRGQARLGPGGPSVDVDVELLHGPQIEHDPALGHAVTGIAVAAAPHRELQPRLAGEPQDARDVLRVGRPDDDRRPPVDVADEDGARPVVRGVARGDHLAVNRAPELRDRRVCETRGRRRHKGLLCPIGAAWVSVIGGHHRGLAPLRRSSVQTAFGPGTHRPPSQMSSKAATDEFAAACRVYVIGARESPRGASDPRSGTSRERRPLARSSASAIGAPIPAAVRAPRCHPAHRGRGRLGLTIGAL